MAANLPSELPKALPNSVPSPDHRRSSSGFFHSVKRSLLGPSASSSDDSEFQSLRADFSTLHSQLSSLRAHVAAYNKAVQQIHQSSLQVSKDFADLLENCPRPHPFSHLLLTFCQGHNDLAEKTKDALYTHSLIELMNHQLEIHQSLSKRIDERQQLRSDWLYYQKKVTSLLHEREKRTRPEKPAETEKIERNQRKLMDTQQRYESFHRGLHFDLQQRLGARLEVYGPALGSFFSAEKQFIADYQRAMGGVQVEDGSPRLNLRFEPPVKAKSNGVAIKAEHSPLVDGQLSVSVEPHSANPFGSLDPSPIGGLTPTATMTMNGSPNAQFLYPYERGQGRATAPPPAAAVANPFGEEEGVPAVHNRTAGYSDPFASGVAFYDVGHAAPAHPSSSSSSSSSSSFSSAVPFSSAPPPAYHPMLYEPFEAVPNAPATPAVVAAPQSEPVEEVVEVEGQGESETEEEEEEGIPAHLLQEGVAAAASPPRPAVHVGEPSPSPPPPLSPPPGVRPPGPSVAPSVSPVHPPAAVFPPYQPAPYQPVAYQPAQHQQGPHKHAVATPPVPVPPKGTAKDLNPFDDD